MRDSKSKRVGWIAWYVIFIPLIGGAVWAILRKIREKNARSQEFERIQRRLAEKAVEAPQPDVES